MEMETIQGHMFFCCRLRLLSQAVTESQTYSVCHIAKAERASGKRQADYQ